MENFASDIISKADVSSEYCLPIAEQESPQAVGLGETQRAADLITVAILLTAFSLMSSHLGLLKILNVNLSDTLCHKRTDVGTTIRDIGTQ